MNRKVGRPKRSESERRAMQIEIARHAVQLFHEEGFEAVSIRRLATAVGCAPMTIYAHFDSKTDILRYLWADVLTDVFRDMTDAMSAQADPRSRLAAAASAFVEYWLTHPQNFRMVFMSGGVQRVDVQTFMQDKATLQRFAFFTELVAAAAPDRPDLKLRVDTLIVGLIGIALAAITIADYPWSTPQTMTRSLIEMAVGGRD